MNKAIAYICCACWLIMQVGCAGKDGLPDLEETYSYKDTKPFGGYVAKEILQMSFPDNYVQTVTKPFEKSDAIFSDTASVYFSISRNLFVDERGADAILNYVYHGNTAFFSAANFDTILLNRIFCTLYNPELLSSHMYQYGTTTTRVIDKLNTSKDSFGYFYQNFENYFPEINTRYCRIVGYNDSGKPNCIVFFWGKGKFFLHCDPRAFSNYFLLTKNNYKYMQELLQVMEPSPQHVYWNDYYIKINHPRYAGGSGLGELFKYPSLKASFWLLLALLLLYILFSLKRKQRIIKIIKPNQNSSVAFTETIARLYLQKHDNKNIADKMITYFYEFIRNNYFLHTNTGSKDFISTLSRKSGVSEEKTTALFNAINHANETAKIDDYQLLSLNEQIQQFYKKRK